MSSINSKSSSLAVRFFFLMFALYACLSFLIPILYWLVSSSFEQLTKIPFYLAIIIMFFVIIKNRFLLKDWFVIFCLFYMPFSLSVGLYLNPLGSAHISHLFPFILPIIGISFGYLTANKYPVVLNKFILFIPKIAFILVLTCIIYYLFYKIGMLAYYGASSLLVLPFFYFFLKRKFFVTFIILIAVVLSGKRSDLLCLVLALVSYYSVKKPIYSLAIFIPSVSVLFVILHHFGFLGRFEILIDLVSSSSLDLRLINEFSSNRLNDIIGALNSINKSPFYWIYGQGFGVTYTYDAVSYDHTVHFTHFSPISYILIGGLVFCFAIYIKLLTTFLKCLFTDASVFKFYFIFLFFLSFLGGSIFFTNPFYWFVVGVVIFELKHDKVF